MIRFAAATGLRLAELRGLRCRDVDRVAHNLHVRRSIVLGREKRTKSGTSGRTILTDYAIRQLDAVVASCEARFTGLMTRCSCSCRTSPASRLTATAGATA